MTAASRADVVRRGRILRRVRTTIVFLPLVLSACDRASSNELERVRVLEIYPTSDELPENQLKLYIEFSGPMTTQSPYDYLQIVEEESGELQPAVFHAMRDGLWDPEGRRLTVLFDPGRIKRGLTNHEALGPPLESGRTYRLEIDGAWPDLWGRPLAASVAKRFGVVAPDRRRPALDDWVVRPPLAGSREPLQLVFGEPLDAAILRRAFRLLGPDGAEIPTELVLGESEESCAVLPLAPWRAGRHDLQVAPHLEDLAGNNLERLFDFDRSAPLPAPAKRWLTFEVSESTPATAVVGAHP